MSRVATVLVLLSTTPSITLAQDAPPEPTPYEVAPQILNRGEILEAVEVEYPDALREAGVEGTTLFFMHVSEDGELLEHRLAESSGIEELDQAASRVAARHRFDRALLREEPVAVWIVVPVRFRQ